MRQKGLPVDDADPAKGTSIFAFEQGTTIQTWPYAGDEDEEQWLLHMEDGTVFACRADGHHGPGPADRPPGEEAWRPLR